MRHPLATKWFKTTFLLLALALGLGSSFGVLKEAFAQTGPPTNCVGCGVWACGYSQCWTAGNSACGAAGGTCIPVAATQCGKYYYWFPYNGCNVWGGGCGGALCKDTQP